MMILAVIAGTVAAFTLFISKESLHTVPEGYVGIYWRGGALLTEIAEPGYHFKYPIVTNYAAVQVIHILYHFFRTL